MPSAVAGIVQEPGRRGDRPGDHSILTRHRPAAADEPDHAGQHPAGRPRTTPGTPPGPPRPQRPPAHPEMPAVPAPAAAGTPTPERQQRLHRPDGSPRASQSPLAQRAARSYTDATGPGRRPTVMRRSWRDRSTAGQPRLTRGWALTGPQSGRNGGSGQADGDRLPGVVYPFGFGPARRAAATARPGASPADVRLAIAVLSGGGDHRGDRLEAADHFPGSRAVVADRAVAGALYGRHDRRRLG